MHIQVDALIVKRSESCLLSTPNLFVIVGVSDFFSTQAKSLKEAMFEFEKAISTIFLRSVEQNTKYETIKSPDLVLELWNRAVPFEWNGEGSWGRNDLTLDIKVHARYIETDEY